MLLLDLPCRHNLSFLSELQGSIFISLRTWHFQLGWPDSPCKYSGSLTSLVGQLRRRRDWSAGAWDDVNHRGPLRPLLQCCLPQEVEVESQHQEEQQWGGHRQANHQPPGFSFSAPVRPKNRVSVSERWEVRTCLWDHSGESEVSRSVCRCSPQSWSSPAGRSRCGGGGSRSGLALGTAQCGGRTHLTPHILASQLLAEIIIRRAEYVWIIK